MKTAVKKAMVFGVIITIFTSTYAAFLNTVMQQGFLTDHFLSNWLSLIPRIYLFLLPFVLIMGPLIKALVNRMFRNAKSNDHS